MIARFRDFICKTQVKIQKPPPSIYQPPFFHLFPLFRQSNFIPPPRFPISESSSPPLRRGQFQLFNMHANSIRHTQKFVYGIDSEYNWELLIACPHKPLCCKKIKRTNTVKNPYSHGTTFEPGSFVPLHP